jgi:hypothetical protein
MQMKNQFRMTVIAASVLVSLGSGQAMAADASYATTGSTSSSVTVYGGWNGSAGGVDTGGESGTNSSTDTFDGSWDDGLVQASGSYSYATTSVTTATSLNTSGVTSTEVGNASSTTTITGSSVSINGNTSVSGTLSSTGSVNLGTTGVTNNVIGNTNAGSSTAITGEFVYVGTGASTAKEINIGNSNVGSAIYTYAGASSLEMTNASAIMENGSSYIQTSNGTNTISGTTNNISGTTNINASINSATNINTGTSNGAVTIGNSNNTTSINSSTVNLGTGVYTTAVAIGSNQSGTTVSAVGGLSSLSINNTSATMQYDGTSTTGGMVQVADGTATIRASNSGALATNSTTGTMTINNGGGYQAYSTTQNTGTGTTIGGIVDNKTYTNKINGNLFVDGNVYINGTLDYVSSNSANTSVIGTGGTSNLVGATLGTSGGTAIVMSGSTGTQTVVDANGRLTNVTGTATESTASLTLTNGYGETHGLVVTETQATLSGGTQSSSLTMADNGATFSDSATGAPVQVHGVNDGTADFDAVNVRQFAGAIASVTAMANIPQVDQDKTFAVGAGYGNFMGKDALALGATYRMSKNGVLKASVASGTGGGRKTAAGLGAAWSW